MLATQYLNRQPTSSLPMANNDIKEQFWTQVKKTETCWTWIGATESEGRYGRFNTRPNTWMGWHIRAHRYSYLLSYGSIPDGQFVLHKCDNSLCVRPDHLFLGTQKDNIRDMRAKGRLCVPDASKLTMEQVKEIRQRLANGEKQYKIAKDYGVWPSTISDIKTRTTWVYSHRVSN